MTDKVINKKEAQLKEQILYNFVHVIEMFPQYTIAQHLSHILRKKDDEQDTYFWNNEKLLKKFEKYFDELNNELIPVKDEVSE